MFEIKRASKFADRLGGNISIQPESQSLIDNIEDGSSNESDSGITSGTIFKPNFRSSSNPFKRYSGNEEFDFQPLVNERDNGDVPASMTHVESNLPKGLNRFKNIAKNTNASNNTDSLSTACSQPLINTNSSLNIEENNISSPPSSAMNRFKNLAKKTESVPKEKSDHLIANVGNPASDQKNQKLVPLEKDAVEVPQVPPKAINRFKSLAKKTSLPPVNSDSETKSNKPSQESTQPIASQDVLCDKPDSENQNNINEIAKPINRFKNLAKKTSDAERSGNEVSKLNSSDITAPPAVNRFKNLAKKTSLGVREHDNSSSINNGIIKADIGKTGIELNDEISSSLPGDQQPPNFMTLVNTVTTVNKVSKIGRRKVRDKLKEQMKKIVEERLSVKQIFARYVEASTLHGFRYTCMDTYLIRRAFWAILMIFGFLYFLWKLDGGIYEYFSYPFSTLSTLDYVGKVQYPAISICIINQFRYSKIIENPRMKELYEQGRLPLRRNWTDISNMDDIPGDTLLEDIKDTSFSLTDILKGCDYIRRDSEIPDNHKRYCGVDNFTSYFSDSGQLCYKLNSHEPGHEPLEVSFSGLRYGYDLLFDLDNNDTIMNNDVVALQVIIHDPNEPPHSNSGFMVAPGFKTYISMQREETCNLPPPYATQCGERQLKYFDTYHQKSCLLEMLTNYTAEKCNCREPFMPDNGLKLCSLRETIDCMYPARESFSEFGKRSSCPVDCKVIKYKNKISTARFLHNPPIGVEEAILKSTIKKFGPLGNLTTEGHVLTLVNTLQEREKLDKHIEENVIVVLFFFGDMTIIKNEQEVSFDFYQFLGDMGGEIGLMLGASLLTFVEFIDLFLFLIYHQLLRLNKVKKEKVRKESNNAQLPNKRKSIRDSIFGKKESLSETDGKKMSKDMLIPKKHSLGMLIPKKKKSGTESELKKRNGKVPCDDVKSKQDPELGNLNLVTKSDSVPTKVINTAIPSSDAIMASRSNGPLPESPLRKMNGNTPWDRIKNLKPKYQPDYPDLGYREGKGIVAESQNDNNRETYI